MVSHDMKYLSTRGGDERLSFEQTVMTGLAPNGGLYIPASLPRLPENWEEAWSKLSFEELALEIYSLFISDEEIPRADLAKLINKSYSTFRNKEIAPLVKIRDNEYILELFHGPTFAFKDVALQFLGNLFEYFLQRRNANKGADSPDELERLTVVGATSGDTGSAAIYGLRGKENVNVFILHPKGRVSPIQEAQMTTVTDPNVFNLAVKGTFDDCQDIVKALFADKEFNGAYRLGAVNSINWARILAQIVYYFSSYFSLLKKLQASASSVNTKNLRIQYAVPTGNFGDILAGFYAKRLGLPVEPLLIATNSNDILARFFKNGVYEKQDSSSSSSSSSSSAPETAQTEKAGGGASDGAQSGSTVYSTLSPAMDILVSSNFERLLWYLAFEHLTSVAVVDVEKGDVDGGLRVRVNKAGEIVNGWMAELKTKGSFRVPAHVLSAAKREFAAERVSDEETVETIRDYYRSDNDNGSYVADPHTSVGLAAARRQRNPAVIQIILSTAHPAKFNEAVTKALESSKAFDFERDVLPEEFKGLLEKERKVIQVEGSDPELTKKVIVEQIGEMHQDKIKQNSTASV